MPCSRTLPCPATVLFMCAWFMHVQPSTRGQQARRSDGIWRSLRCLSEELPKYSLPLTYLQDARQKLLWALDVMPDDTQLEGSTRITLAYNQHETVRSVPVQKLYGGGCVPFSIYKHCCSVGANQRR